MLSAQQVAGLDLQPPNNEAEVLSSRPALGPPESAPGGGAG